MWLKYPENTPENGEYLCYWEQSPMVKGVVILTWVGYWLYTGPFPFYPAAGFITYFQKIQYDF